MYTGTGPSTPGQPLPPSPGPPDPDDIPGRLHTHWAQGSQQSGAGNPCTLKDVSSSALGPSASSCGGSGTHRGLPFSSPQGARSLGQPWAQEVCV